MDDASSHSHRIEALADALQAFVNAQTWVASREVVRTRYLSLVAPEVDELFETMLSQNSRNPEAVNFLTYRRELLAQVKRDGVDLAYGTLITPHYISSLEQEMQNLKPGSKRHVDVVRALLALADQNDRTQLANLKLALGTSLALTGEEADVSEAIEVLKGALSNASPQENSRLWGALQLTLAETILQRAGRAELAGDSIEHYEAALLVWKDLDPTLAHALELRTTKLLQARANCAPSLSTRLVDLQRASELTRREDQPEDWARLKHNLGETYRLLAAAGEADTNEDAIEHLAKALEVFTAADFPRDFGLAANSLGAAYLQRSVGNRSDNTEHAIALLDAALEVRPRAKYPDFWAKTKINLGSAYMQRTVGNASRNIETAIENLQASLSDPICPYVETSRGYIERQLAEAFVDRVEGDRSENLNSAILYGRQAARLLAADPTELARAQYRIAAALHAKHPRTVEETEEAIKLIEQTLNVAGTFKGFLERAQAEQTLAIFYENRETGEQAANQLHAIVHYEAARLLYVEAGVPIGAATCHYWIGCVLRKRRDLPEGDRLAAAIEQLEFAIADYPPDAPKDLLIDMHLEIGEALIDSSLGDRGDNMNLAIGHFEAALAELDEGDARRANAHASLGVALYEWRGGDRASNLERSREQQLAVLTIVSREKDPQRWATAHHNLGNVYGERLLGDRAQNIEDAIENFKAALEFFVQGEHPEDWAMIQNSLGGVYAVRTRGDRSENLENAIACYAKALTVYTEKAFPADWAMTLNNLGTAYMHRIAGYGPDNLEQAISAFERSLIYRTRESLPFFWAMTHVNLGNALADRQYGQFEDNLHNSARHYQLALEVYTKEASPTDWAWVHLSLGSLSSDAGLSIEDRIEHLHCALSVYRQDRHPERCAVTHNNLALIYRKQAEIKPSARQEAISHLQTACQGISPGELPRLVRTLQFNLGDEYLLLNKWQAALDAYQRAIEVGESLLDSAYSEQGRLEESAATSRIYAHASYCLIQLGEVEKGIAMFDAGRTRQLAESLSRIHADLSHLPEPLRLRLQDARRSWQEIEANMRFRDEDLQAFSSVDLSQLQQAFPDAPVEQRHGIKVTTLTLNQARAALGAHGLRINFADKAREARRLLDEVVKEARAIDPTFMRACLNAGDAIQLIPVGGALVVFILTPAGSAAVVIPHDAPAIEPSQVIALGGDLNENLQKLFNDWLKAYFDSHEQSDLQLWQDAIESTTQTLWLLVMAPVQERLDALGLGKDAPVVLMPQSRLALLPLHAAWREVDGHPRAFLDDHAVSYTPSLYALKSVHSQIGQPARLQKRLLAVMNPTQDLPYAAVEGESVSSHFASGNTCVLSEDNATETAVIAAVLGSNYLHFATHGQYAWRDVMRSHLQLAQGSRLTLAQVMSTDFDLSAARLVVLSACETGLTEFRKAPDEFLGFPACFIASGAPSIISALWAINDLSTALLIKEFYRRHIVLGQIAADALRMAQIWLRDSTALQLGLADHWQRIYEASNPRDGYAYRMMLYFKANPNVTPFAAQYHWAAFTFNGA